MLLTYKVNKLDNNEISLQMILCNKHEHVNDDGRAAKSDKDA